MNECFQVKPNTYVHRRIAGEDVLISIGQNIAEYNGFVEMNETSAFLFDLMQNPVTKEELADKLCAEYSISKTQALEDISEFLDDMKAHHMVNIYDE